MKQFDGFLNYRLLKGSHDFPGEAGGACLNEVAVVAAGFDYRSVHSAADCPPCFSRVISAYVIGLNDAMPDDVRQDLKQFVLRLAGSADSAIVEQQRAEFLALKTVRRVLPIALRAAGLPDQARHCSEAGDLSEAQVAAWAAEVAEVGAAEVGAAGAAEAARAAAGARAAEVWPVAISILDDVLKIGARAPAIDDSCVETRLRATFGERVGA